MSLHTPQPEPADGAQQRHESADGVGSGGRWREPVVLGPGAQVLAALAAVVVLGALIGTGLHHLADQADDPQPRHTPITSGHSPQPTPTPSPSVQPSLSAEDQALKDAALAMPAPERPEGMDKLSPEGARAAAEYFLSLYPYVYATGDLSDWQAMSDAGCVFCNNVITNVTELHSAGGWTDPLQQEVLAVSYGVSDEDPEVWVVTLDVSHPEGTDHDGLGGTSTVNAEDTTFLLQLRWTGQTWIAEEGATR
ncbi:hypothetical protein H6X68_04415 [Actinomyces sp. 186855]|uniref:DUF6318 family protein n=1 Tax=Actinomyces sp. 186855 TaxID=2761164 RepID=UPI002017CBF5|nr:DUF6318 family protein [Actinomyces sp. 186855]MCL3791845.1 hypothetical protein [Actinomyces sp. 186855]